MAEERLAQVRELIKSKRYEEARNLLLTMDDPQARKMLQTLEGVIQDSKLPRNRARANWHIRVPIILFVTGLLFMLVMVIVAEVQRRERQSAFDEWVRVCVDERTSEVRCISPMIEEMLTQIGVTLEPTP